MDIKINAVRFAADNKLEEFVKSKVEKLGRFFEDILGADVYLRVDKPQSEENKIAEIRLNIPGYDLFAKKQSDSFEKSIDLSCDALRRQIKKHKEKLVVNK